MYLLFVLVYIGSQPESTIYVLNGSGHQFSGASAKNLDKKERLSDHMSCQLTGLYFVRHATVCNANVQRSVYTLVYGIVP